MEELRESGKSVSKLKPPKIVLKKKPPLTQIPQVTKKSCLKPPLSAINSSQSTTSSLAGPSGLSHSPIANSSGKSAKSVQIKTGFSNVKTTKPPLGLRNSKDSSLTSTFRELFRDFPNPTSSKTSTNIPPPYRNPPPVLAGKRASYEEIEPDPSYGKKDSDFFKKIKKDNEYSSPSRKVENNYVIFKTISTRNESSEDGSSFRSEYFLDRLQNLPVKPHKTISQHMENYCLFDPSVDFISEKEEQKHIPGKNHLNYESVEPNSGASASSAVNLVAETDLYILDSLTDAMYGQSIGLTSLNRANSSQNQCQFNDRYIQIYTDWANYYLERAKSKRKVTDLSTDCKDGLLLAEIIEAVTSFKVPDLIKKPKNPQQMHENVKSCLSTLQERSVGGLDKISSNDISAGRLKAVLSLFFALSRFKQETKLARQKASPQHFPINQQIDEQQKSATATNPSAMSNRQIAVPYAKVNNGGGGTSIPLPASARRCPPEKVRPLPPTPGQQSVGSINGLNKGSHIPDPHGRNPSALKAPTSYVHSPEHSQTPNGHQENGHQKQSMLEKFKLFNREKTERVKQQQIAKRTSSSSGFSSAKSERSDSSLSLNEHTFSGHSSSQQQKHLSNGSMRKSESHNLKLSSSANSKVKYQPTSSHSNLSSIKPTSITSTTSRDSLKLQTKKTDKLGNGHSSIKREGSKPKQIPGSLKLEPKPPPANGTNSKTNSLTRRDQHNQYGKSLNGASNSNGNLQHQQRSNGNVVVSSTGIPKPMAAIKGTTKIQNGDESRMHVAKPQPNLNSGYYVQNYPQNQEKEHKTQIMNSMEVEIQDDSKNINSIINAVINKGSVIGMTDSTNSSSTSTTGLHSNSSESSVIFRPSSESGSDMLKASHMSPMRNIIPNRKIDKFSQDHMSNNKYHTAPSMKQLHGNGMLQEKPHPSGVVPMRVLLDEFNVTLPTRGPRGQRQIHYGSPALSYVSDDMSYQSRSGYCSDGDGFRKMGKPFSNPYGIEVDNGYLSDGCSPGKHLMNVIRRRQMMLPTTIEERSKSNRFLDELEETKKSMDYNGQGNSSDNGPPPPLLPVRHPINAKPDHHQHHHSSSSMSENQNELHHQNIVRKEKGSSSPGHSRRAHHSHNGSSSSPSGSSSKNQMSGGGTSRSKGVPQSFGYIKRTNGSMASNIIAMDSGPQHQLLLGANSNGFQGGNRTTAHVSAVPRSSKMKVSGGTQTCSTDLQTKGGMSNSPQHRSFSLTGPGATQLSQSIRERLATGGSHSLPKPGTDLHAFQHRMANRMSGKLMDGSLSDTQAYAEVKQDYGSYAMWLKHSNTAVGRLSEGDSLESVQIGSPAVTRNHKMLINRGAELHYSPNAASSRLNRSNSISYLRERTYPRSTKSEKMYPTLLSRTGDIEIEPYYCLPVGSVMNANGKPQIPWSQPTSPTPVCRSGVLNGPLSPTQMSGQKIVYQKKNDEVHGSAASLLSGGSSLYGTAGEEKHNPEIRRLKKELMEAKEQVMSLSSQLSTNAHVVSAFEQSLSNMTQRFHQLSATAERKDSELTDLRQTIELLRKQSIQAGLTSAHMQSMGNSSSINNLPKVSEKATMNQGPGMGQNCQTGNGQMSKATSKEVIPRHLSSDSMCSLNSISSGCSTQEKKKKKGWLRSSFTKAFSRNAKISKTSRHVNNIGHSVENFNASSNDIGLPPTGLNNNSHTMDQHQKLIMERPIDTGRPPPVPIQQQVKHVTVIENAKPIDAIPSSSDPENTTVVEDLKKQLREKDLVLTDSRLEALILKDTVMKMREEMMNLKQNNERLQKLVTSRSLAGSEISLSAVNSNIPTSPSSEPRRYSLADGSPRPVMELPKTFEEAEEENIPPAPAPEPVESLSLNSPTTHADLTPPSMSKVGDEDGPDGVSKLKACDLLSTRIDELDPSEGKKISIAVYLAQPDSFHKYAEEANEFDYYYNENLGQDEDRGASSCEFIINYTYISGKTTWQNLDYIVRKTFKDYLSKIDPGTSLGLNTDSITSYHLGEAKRGPEMGFPELLPCGYIIGNVKTLYICLQGVGCLAFDSLIPRSIVHRYISLLTEHRRLILCGPSGTGKSYLARKLAEFLVARSGRGNPAEAIATFNVDHKSNKELQQYLVHVAEQASMTNGVSELPSVIILDNLHHASALGDVFSCLLSAGPAAKLPCIIGTMSQATCNTTNLQLHHNFRWVLTANHMEPVKGFLSRFLRRKLFQLELSSMQQQPQLSSVFNWLPSVWQHINRFLESHSSSDVTIGPRLFLSCPMELNESQVWFTEIWNFHLAPYLIDAVKEGVQLYGRRGGAWIDPSAFIRDSYPWPVEPTNVPSLRQINAEDVGLESGAANSGENQDPLLNMLMRLQEAANYSNNQQDQESDCASLDSNITQDSFAGSE